MPGSIKPKHGSLFTGIGGFDYGAEAAGLENVWACEIEKKCRAHLAKTFKHTIIYDDVRTIIPEELERVDVISAGFPCQDIASTNRQGTGIHGSKSSLFFDIIRIADVLRPKYILLENSPNLINRGFETVLAQITKIGYNAEWSCLQGYDVGTAQERERLYIIAYPHQDRRAGLLQRYEAIAKEISGRQAKSVRLSDAIDRVKRRQYIERGKGVNDVPRFAFRLGALGNAVMPNMAEALFKCLEF